MNRFAGFLLTIVFFALTASGCSSLGRQDEAEQPDSYENQPPITTEKLPGAWSYKIEITHEGSRSEGSIGSLYYRYSELPPVFDSVIIAGIRYDYIPMENIWDNSGFIKTESPTFVPEKTTDPVKQTEIKQGWYITEQGKIKAGTPSDWFYANADNLTAWIMPSAINDFVLHYSLNERNSCGLLIRASNE